MPGRKRAFWASVPKWISVGPRRPSPTTLTRPGAPARTYSSLKITCWAILAPRPPCSAGQPRQVQPAAASSRSQRSRVSKPKVSSPEPPRPPRAAYSPTTWSVIHVRTSLRNDSSSGRSLRSIAPEGYRPAGALPDAASEGIPRWSGGLKPAYATLAAARRSGDRRRSEGGGYHGSRDRAPRRGVAGPAHPGPVRGAAAPGHGAGLVGRLRPCRQRRRLPLRRLRGRALRDRRQVRIGIGLAELRPGGGRRGDRREDRSQPLHDQDRDHLRQVWRTPRPRLLGRADRDRPALLRELPGPRLHPRGPGLTRLSDASPGHRPGGETPFGQREGPGQRRRGGWPAEAGEFGLAGGEGVADLEEGVLVEPDPSAEGDRSRRCPVRDGGTRRRRSDVAARAPTATTAPSVAGRPAAQAPNRVAPAGSGIPKGATSGAGSSTAHASTGTSAPALSTWSSPSAPSARADRRSFRWTSAVAKSRLGPISSATISTFERRSPSSVSQLRCSSRPVTTTRMPLARLRAAFSARSRQQTTSKNETASSHSLVSRSCQRRLTATPSRVVAWPSRV